MPVKTIAMYLPQFHRTPENDEWWGEGFTEWTAVRQGRALYKGHKQPKVPLNHNYYNLLNKETLKNQAAIAKRYGIYGFCFYHYWFSEGRKILEKPAENLLKWKEIELPFCFCWANQTWARTWSNIKNANAWSDAFEKQAEKTEDGILLSQKYGREDLWKKHFEYLLNFFRDSRYIKINHKPVLLIYKSDDIYCLSQMLAYWNDLARENGFEGIYTIGENCTNCKNVDAVMLHQPASAFMSAAPDYRTEDGLSISSYETTWRKILETPKHSKKSTYYMGLSKYDDTPRRGKRGLVVENASADLFREFFWKLRKRSEQENVEFVFLNAWNEWGEGMYLEADEADRYDFLEAHRQIVEGEYKPDMKDPEIRINQTAIWKTSRKSKMEEYYNLLSRWMYLKENNKNIADYLIRNGIMKVAVYGYGDLGKHLYIELEKSSVKVAYIIDRIVEIPGLIKKPDDHLDMVDAIIVTPFLEFEEILEFLQSKQKCKVISIEELILESL